MAGLHLLAQDEADLPALSALLQDATLRTQDIAFDTPARRLVLLLNRYRWEAATPSRIRAALRIETVQAVARRHWPRADTVLNLLALDWSASQLLLTFSDDIQLKASCEVPELLLEDIGAPWDTPRIPRHKL
jgi:hypothetical protein